MPALRIFGRRWLLASDDVPAPAAVLAVFHLVWVVLLTAWLVEIHGPEDCKGVGPYYVAVGGLLASFFLSLVLEVYATAVGLRGSIFETRKRAALSAIIYANGACMAAQVAFNGYSTRLIYTEPPQCSTSAGELWNPVDIMYGVVWSCWAIIVGLLALIVVSYNLFPNYRDPKQWQQRCACMGLLCCGMRRDRFSHSGGTAKRLGNLFALLFGHVDWTLSDVLTAFGLALTLQRMQRTRAAAVARRMEQRERGSAGAEGHGADGPANAGLQAGRGGGPLSDAPRSADGSPASSDGLLESAERGMARNSRDAETAKAGEKYATIGAEAGDSEDGMGGSGGALDGHLGVVDAASLQEAAYYMKYAFAAYGWMLLVWQKQALGVAELCCGRTCGLWTRVAAGSRQASTLLQTSFVNSEAILQAAGLRDEDLVCVRQEGELPHVLPYFVAIDRPKQAVVVAFRGSLSLDDVVRDLLFEPCHLDPWVKEGRRWEDPLPPLRPATASTRYAAHAGILEASKATLEDIRECGHLQDLLQGPTARCAGFRLVLCGHSLGAGCAFLVSLYLRDFFPRLRCFAFSPPGGLATAELCAGAVEWCTSSVCGKEWIPRLTIATFERMRDDMVYAAARCRQPKAAVVAGWLRRKTWAERELFYAPDALPEEPKEWIDRYQASLAATEAKMAFVMSAARFGPPGRVMQLRPTGVEQGSGWRRPKQRTYKAVWVDGQKVVDEGILMSSRMMADHMPDYCLAVLQRLAAAATRHLSSADVRDDSGVAVDEAVEASVSRRTRSSGGGSVAAEHSHPSGRSMRREE